MLSASRSKAVTVLLEPPYDDTELPELPFEYLVIAVLLDCGSQQWFNILGDHVLMRTCPTPSPDVVSSHPMKSGIGR